MKNIIYMMYVQPILLCWDAHGGQDESILTNKKKEKEKEKEKRVTKYFESTV